jgi:hypothetical protein
MGEPERDPLLVTSLATFHTTLLLAVILALGQATGAIGDLLGGLGTLVGFGLFGLLWGTTLYTNWRWLGDVSVLADEPDIRHVLRRAFVWGALDGVLFFLGLLAVLVLSRISPDTQVTLDALLGALGVVVFLAALGSAVAIIVGGIVGVVLGALDLGLVRLAGAFVPEKHASSGRL